MPSIPPPQSMKTIWEALIDNLHTNTSWNRPNVITLAEFCECMGFEDIELAAKRIMVEVDKVGRELEGEWWDKSHADHS
ncbi:MAG: hypothetical protein V3W44_10985 [Dehalococcoidales bacterium]